MADSVGTVAGAFMGTTVTSYVESGAGVKAGGRTGMTSLVIGVLFLACLFFAPLATSLPKEIDGAALLYVAVLFVKILPILNGMILLSLRLQYSP